MAVTMTAYTRLVPIRHGKYIYTWVAQATGDGSGGTVSYNDSLPGLISGDNISVLDAYLQQGNVGTMYGYMRLLCNDWEYSYSSLASGYNHIYLANMASGQWGGSAVLTTPRERTHDLPIFLGKPVVASPTLYCVFETNTNTKEYFARVQFLINNEDRKTSSDFKPWTGNPYENTNSIIDGIIPPPETQAGETPVPL